MAQDKKSVVVYTEWIELFKELSDEEAGRLIKHFFEYVNDLNPVAPDRITQLSFIPIKQTLKRDLVKYENYIDKQKSNGSKGGRPKKEDNPSVNTKTQKTQAFLQEPKKADNVNVNVNDSVNVNYNKNIIPKVDTLDFVKLLKYLNSKTGRGHKVLNKTLKSKYLARLKDGFTAKDIRLAIDNATSSQYHKENGYQYLTPEFFSRADTLNKYGVDNKAQTLNTSRTSRVIT
jgi:uncharacterized phage protein (TIGR02220 family)